MFNRKQKKEKGMEKKKETRIAYDLNSAIIAGKDVWRTHTEVMQWLGEVPPLIDRDIALLDNAINQFRLDGGKIDYNDAERMWSCDYNNISVRIQFDERGEIKYRAMEDTNLGRKNKDAIKKIATVVSAHHELEKRLFAKSIMSELISYLEDHSTKESIDNHILKMFKDNVEVLWNSVNANENAFEIDLKAATKEWEI